MLISNVLQYIENNNEYNGLYDNQAMQKLKTGIEALEIKDQEIKTMKIKENDRRRLEVFLLYSRKMFQVNLSSVVLTTIFLCSTIAVRLMRKWLLFYLLLRSDIKVSVNCH